MSPKHGEEIMMTGIPAIEAAVQKSREWIREVSDITGREEADSLQMMRGVLHVLRDRLPVAEAADLAAQLPVLLRGYYFEGWRPVQQPVAYRNRREFLDAVAAQFEPAGNLDPQQAVETVLGLLEKKISAGEMEDVKQNMPEALQEIFPG
jgi:uncharacterized protein (DUF2267 family)